jgi:hypothetical protein
VLGRRQAVLVALAVLAAALFPATAIGAAAPVKVKPAFTVKSAAVSGAKVRFAITVVFATPAGGKPASLCSGRVVASTRLSRKRRASWAAKLAATATGCAATISGSLPKQRLGAKVAFAFSYKGTAKLHAFAVAKTLKLTQPAAVAPTGSAPAPAPTAPAAPAPAAPQPPAGPPSTPIPDVHLKGNWATDDPTSGPYAQYRFAINPDNVILSVDDFGGSFKWYCGAGETLTSANFSFDKPLTVFNEAAGGAYNLISGNTNVVYTFDFKFTGPSTGTGSFSASGMYDYGVAGVQSCHVAQTFALYHYG